jgi:hypothetical protein
LGEPPGSSPVLLAAIPNRACESKLTRPRHIQTHKKAGRLIATLIVAPRKSLKSLIRWEKGSESGIGGRV